MSIDIKAIKERLSRATPQPWYLQRNDLIGGWCVKTVDAPPSEVPGEVADFVREEDARLIASAPEDLTALIEEVERLEDWLHSALDDRDYFKAKFEAERAAAAAFVHGARLDDLADAILRGEHVEEGK